jgi:hypothetical protein
MAMRRTTAGLTQVIINDLDEGVRPASILDGRGESVLTRRTFPMRKYLVQGRLADIHQGLAAEVMGVDFRMVGNGHEVPSPRVIDRSVIVAINFTTAVSACAWPEGVSLLSAVTSIGQWTADASLRVAASQRPQDSSPSCTRRQASTGTGAPSPDESIAARRVS